MSDASLKTEKETSTLRRYIHDIRNMKPLNEEKLHMIRTMTEEEKITLIMAMNYTLIHMNELLVSIL